jgi:hypothetical protein
MRVPMPELLTTEEAAAYLRLSASKARRAQRRPPFTAMPATYSRYYRDAGDVFPIMARMLGRWESERLTSTAPIERRHR